MRNLERERPTTTPVRQSPGARGLPLVGHTLEYIRDPLAVFRRRWEEYGPVSFFSGMGTRWVTLLGPDACEAALHNKDRAFAHGDAWRLLVGPFFDRGLMLLDFNEHLGHRRILQQAFTRERLARYTEAMHLAVEEGLTRWSPDRDFRAYPALKELTLGLATFIFMGGAEGTTAAEMARVNRAFIDCVQAATAVIRHPVPGTRWWRGLRGRRLLEDFFRRYLPTRRDSESDDLFSVLCHIRSEEGEGFSDEDVVNHMIFLLMAAHDTSTITLSTMLQYLGQHPDWQARYREESLALGPSPGLEDIRALGSLDRIMKSLDRVLKECLRLVTPVPVLARRTVKDTEVLGYAIPEGSYVAVVPHFTHHMPEVWPDPDRFDPERFSPERREDKVHRYAWEPFGGGVHKCLGMYFADAEIKTVMHHLLHRFTWHVDPGYVAPLNFTSLPFPSDGQPVDLRLR